MAANPFVDPVSRVEAARAARRSPFRLRAVSELSVERGGGYFIKGVIPLPGLTVVYGPPGSGKTFLVGHAAACGATGREFFGHRVRRGTVVYVAAENPASVAQRFAAWRDPLDLDGAPLILLDGPVDLRDGGMLDDLVDALRDLTLEQGGITAIIVDTVAASAPGMDENTSADMGLLLKACAALRDEFGAAVVLVHHCGKEAARGPRGHSSLHGAADAELEVEVLACGDRQAKVTKARDGAVGETLVFRLDALLVGEDDDGDPLSTCTVVELADTPDKPRGVGLRLTAQDRIALDALRELSGEIAELSIATSTMPGGKYLVSVDRWRERFRARRGVTGADMSAEERGKELDTSRKAFQRAVDHLSAAHIVGIQEDKAWMW